jgi:hypothetical protein
MVAPEASEGERLQKCAGKDPNTHVQLPSESPTSMSMASTPGHVMIPEQDMAGAFECKEQNGELLRWSQRNVL